MTTDKNKLVPIAENFGESLASEWQSVLSKMLRGYPLDDEELVVAEGYRHVSRLFASANLCFMEGSAAYPYFVKLESVQRQFGLPGVDCVYHYTQLHGDYSYRISGNRGSARVFELEIWHETMSRVTEWRPFSTTSRVIEPGEDLDIRLSREPGGDDWIELPEGECCVLVRQYYYDWINEQPAFLFIEREGAVYPPPQLTLAEVEERSAAMASFMRETAGVVRQSISQYLATEEGALEVMTLPFGFTKLFYVRGHVRIEPDEAVILDVEPPEARYWNFQLSNVQWESLDYHQRMTAVNGHEAVLDSDGVFRLVFSASDPGTPNWIDTSGRKLCLISGRYFSPDSTPVPEIKKVPFKEVLQHLPADTQRVTKEQRQATIRARMLSTVRRQAGD